ncbi:hypothetical protein GCM10023196_080570 [Actinoallomurus vinaceus]|uniref:Uncharacterized protein n=1 Tax=Actinoallomurus vinaceus TaxID=1080074 RepID=A0ABP8UMW6_9ACTN
MMPVQAFFPAKQHEAVTLAATSNAVPLARRLVAEVTRHWRLPTDLRENAEFIMSELWKSSTSFVIGGTPFAAATAASSSGPNNECREDYGPRVDHCKHSPIEEGDPLAPAMRGQWVGSR